jgi:hypothetical protein
MASIHEAMETLHKVPSTNRRCDGLTTYACHHSKVNSRVKALRIHVQGVKHPVRIGKGDAASRGDHR